MKITIKKIENINGNIVVSFNSVAGEGIARWVNEVKPVKDYDYDVEIEIDKSIYDLVHDTPQSEYKGSMIIKEGLTIFRGEVDSIESDGMAFFRLSKDCLIMIESGSCHVKVGDWITLAIRYDDIEISAQGM